MTTSAAIALPFSFDADGKILSTIDQKKIIQDRVVIGLMTFIGERVNRPRYGTSIKGSTFESVDTAQSSLPGLISTGFSELFPYLNLTSTDVFLDENEVIQASITYSYGSGSLAETVSFKVAVLDSSGNVITEA